MGKKKYRYIGQAYTKVDGLSKVTGQTRYADDMKLPRMLFCKLLRADVPHALLPPIPTRDVAQGGGDDGGHAAERVLGEGARLAVDAQHRVDPSPTAHRHPPANPTGHGAGLAP